MEVWVDLYQILQVHPEAEADIIQSAYKRLCKKYHPDVNNTPQAEEKIKQINHAYEILGNETSRKAYHFEWIRRRGAGHSASPRVEVHERVVYVNREPQAPMYGGGSQGSYQVLFDYFKCLSEKRLRDAFKLISEKDKQRFTLGSFVEWQGSVAAIYEIGRFSLKLFKKHDGLSTYYNSDESGNKVKAEEFTVTINEKEVSSGLVSEYNFNKYAVLENDTWKVYLGYRDLTPLLLQFKTMASSQDEAQILGLWEKYKETTDMEMAMPNLKSFEHFVEQESYRRRRYDRPFSIAVFHAKLPPRIKDKSHRDRVIKYIGYIISREVRMLDHVAYLGGDLYGVVFAETDESSAEMAVKRIYKAVKHDIAACFDFEVELKVGYTEYDGRTTTDILNTFRLQLGADSFIESTPQSCEKAN